MAGDSIEPSRRSALPASNPRSEDLARSGDLFDLRALPGILAEHGNVESRKQFLGHFATHLGRFLRASALLIHELSESRFRVQGFFADPGLKIEPRAWVPATAVLEQVSRSGSVERSDVLVGGRHFCRIVFPASSGEEAPLCVTAFLDPEFAADPVISAAVARLAGLAIPRHDAIARLAEGEAAFDQATHLLDMVAQTAKADSLNRALHLLAVELQGFTGCLRVAIGSGSAKLCHVRAISGVNQGERRSLGHAQLASGMREALALGEATVWPAQEDISREVGISANQDDLLHSYKAGRVLILPLGVEEMNYRGAIAFLWPLDAPEIPARTLRLVFACRPHLSALIACLHRSKPRSFHARLLQQWRSGPTRRAVLIGAAVLTIALMAFPITYRVPVTCQVEPLLRRTIAAPFESRLETSHVKPGDRVVKNQVLAELDGREIRLALAEAIAARNAALKKRDNAMVLSDPAGLQMAQLESDRLALEVQRLQFRSDNLLVRSPLDGVVLAGDLERSEGVPVSPGQKLFEIAPLEGMILELAVPDREVGHVAADMEVTYRLESDGGKKRRTRLEKLHPASEVSDGEHVFIAEAPLENADGFLRPGMKGEARVLSKRKPIAWILFHGLWEFLRLKLW